MTLTLLDGSTWPRVPVGGASDEEEELLLDELLEDELLLDELLLLVGCAIVHGGTTRFLMLLFSAITSWFCTACDCVFCGVVPPGDIRIVLTAD